MAGRRLVAIFDISAGGADDRTAMPTCASLAVFYRDAEPDGLPSPATAAQLEALTRRLDAIYSAAADELRSAARALQGEFFKNWNCSLR